MSDLDEAARAEVVRCRMYALVLQRQYNQAAEALEALYSVLVDAENAASAADEAYYVALHADALLLADAASAAESAGRHVLA